MPAPFRGIPQFLDRIEGAVPNELDVHLI